MVTRQGNWRARALCVTLALPSLLAFASGAAAFADDDSAPSCCGTKPGDESQCHHAAGEVLLPLGQDATEKERALYALIDAAREARTPYLSARMIADLRARRAALSADAPPMDRFSSTWSLSHLLMSRGDLDEAIELMEWCLEFVESEPSFHQAVHVETLYNLGLAFFRRAERDNCIAYHNPDSCIFPLAGDAVHVETRGAEGAKAVFDRLLEVEPNYRQLEAQWLLNIAHMALGTYPHEVPEEHVYPPKAFESEGEVQRFTDIGATLGVHRYTRAGSILMDDFDGDGHLDLLSSSFDPRSALRLFRNPGAIDRAFEDVSEARGLAHQLGGLRLVHGDVNGDGRLDVLVLRGGHLQHDGQMPNSLLIQDEEGRFVDRTREYGIELAAPTQTASLADVDLDGDLDLFIGYETVWNVDTKSYDYPSKLWRNEGGKRFVDVTAAAGIKTTAACIGAVFGDIDGDRDPDLYLSHAGKPNQLYVNAGDWTFTEVAAKRGVTQPKDSYATWFFDYDNDGDLDLFVCFFDFVSGEHAIAAYYRDGSILSGTPRLYENDGDGNFTDVTDRRALARVNYPLGASFGDLDNDGFLDIYLGTGAVEMSALWPNIMLRSAGGQRFEDVTGIGGFGHLQKGQGIAFGDLDGDGDQDIAMQVAGFHLDDGFGDVVFANPGHAGMSIAIDLVGTRTNRFGIGSRVRVQVRSAEGVRDIVRFAGGNSSSGGNSLRLEIGLGTEPEIELVEVTWQATGNVQTWAGLEPGQHVRLIEGRAEPEVVEL